MKNTTKIRMAQISAWLGFFLVAIPFYTYSVGEDRVFTGFALGFYVVCLAVAHRVDIKNICTRIKNK